MVLLQGLNGARSYMSEVTLISFFLGIQPRVG